MNKSCFFFNSHETDTPLILPNIWNVASAKAFEKAGFKALGTSSAAIAQSMGYEDGENLPFEQLIFILKRIMANTDLPVSVDLEGGYSRILDEVIKNIKSVYNLGVVGINLEDSVVVNGERKLLTIDAFKPLLQSITNFLRHHEINLFINLRTDTYLLNRPDPLRATLERVKAYEESGVNGIFIPMLTEKESIQQVVSSTSLPINLMAHPSLPNVKELKHLGVKRISMGNGLFNLAFESIEGLSRQISLKQSFHPLYS